LCHLIYVHKRSFQCSCSCSFLVQPLLFHVLLIERVLVSQGPSSGVYVVGHKLLQCGHFEHALYTQLIIFVLLRIQKIKRSCIIAALLMLRTCLLISCDCIRLCTCNVLKVFMLYVCFVICIQIMFLYVAVLMSGCF
jgi:hypothetical protein